MWSVNWGRVIRRYQNHLYRITNHHETYMRLFFLSMSCKFKNNRNETYRYWRKAGGWHAISYCDARDCLTPGVVALHIPPSGQPPQFRVKNPRSHVIIWITAQFISHSYFTCISGWTYQENLANLRLWNLSYPLCGCVNLLMKYGSLINLQIADR